MKVQYEAVAPLLAGEGSRAFLGLEINDARKARPVVLVFAPETSAVDEVEKAKLLQQTRRAAQLQHPNIIRVHGVATMEDGLARVVEFVDGESLRKVLDAVGTLPPPLAALVAAEAAAGVHFAHLTGNAENAPWVHGDIRPETVMVSFSGACKVTGYGALQVAPKEMGGKRVIGRRMHTTPEQVVGGRDVATVETDVYLLGAMLYECLTGKAPFAEYEDFDRAVMSEPLASDASKGIPAELGAVLQRATAKRAQDRYASALDFHDAVEQAMGVLPSGRELAAFLQLHFPPTELSRAARRDAMAAAVADLARKHPGDVLSLTVEHQVLAPPPVVVDWFAPPPAPAQRRTWVVQILVTAALGFGLGGVVVGLSKPGRAPEPAAEPVAAVRAPVPAPPPPAPAPTPPEPAEATPKGTVPARGTPEAPAPKEPSLAAQIPPAPLANEPGEVTVVVHPPVDVVFEGQRLGRTPLTAKIPNGRQTLTLTNEELGIQVVRGLNVSGKTTQSWAIQKGTVQISAPEGAVLVIDGKQVGVAPVGEVSAYEGQHRLQVTMGSAKYAQPFSLRAGETMYLTVELNPQR